MRPQIQSNSIRGDFLHQYAGMVIQEILDTVGPMLGPGATDSFIIKAAAPYYTRDGKEVLESLRFDNELANYFHHILYQAVYNQADKVGDGTTTVAVLYCYIYRLIRHAIRDDSKTFSSNINLLRKEWMESVDVLVEELKAQAIPLTEDRLLSMLYTCTQDADLAAKLYRKLGSAIMEGAYIMPRKSNIDTDLAMTVYDRPTFRAVKQFSLKPIPDDGTVDNCVIFHCNGMLDIAHYMTLVSLITLGQYTRRNDPSSKIDMTYIILCNGINDATRRTLRELVHHVRNMNWDLALLNNIAVYTLTDYRAFTSDEVEDLSTILTDEPGIGGLVNAITFETLLYKAFFEPASMNTDPIEDLERFDMDEHLIDKITRISQHPYPVVFDSIKGIALEKEIGPVAKARYANLLEEIKDEKSPVRRIDLQKRLRRTYGKFIDVEVGSALLKDSQRKFELILDAILSASDAVENGVLVGNSILHAIRACFHVYQSNDSGDEITVLIKNALISTMVVLINNYDGFLPSSCPEANIHGMCKDEESYDVKDFNLTASDRTWWPTRQNAVIYAPIDVPAENGVDADYPELQINPQIMESAGIMINILKNSQLAMELAKTENFHISGDRGFMGNYVQPDDAGER